MSRFYQHLSSTRGSTEVCWILYWFPLNYHLNSFEHNCCHLETGTHFPSFMLLRPIKVWFGHALYFVCVSYYFREAGQGRCHEGNLFWIWGDHWPTCLFKWRYCVKRVVWNWQLFLSYLFYNRNVNIGARFKLSSRMNSLELQVFKLLVALQVWRQMNVWWTMEGAGKTQI